MFHFSRRKTHRKNSIKIGELIASGLPEEGKGTDLFSANSLRPAPSPSDDLPGRRTSIAYPNGVATSYAYDPLGNLTEILTKGGKAKKSDLLSAYTYTHDNIGNRLTRTDLDRLRHGTRNEYAYDPVYRLLEALPVKLEGKAKPQPNKAEIFAYDPVGNRLAGPKTADTYVHNQANQLLEGPKYSYQYDKNGNMTGKIGFNEEGKYASWAYEYDFEIRLTRATKMDAGETKVVAFKYDPFGRQIEKRVDELGGQDVRTYAYVYDNEDIILEFLTKTEGHKERTETTRYLHGPGIDEALAIEQEGNLYFYQADGLGSITSLTDVKGQVIQSYDYSSFGIPKPHGNHVKQPYTYTGREWDSETGLYFYRARYYDPVAGRFVSMDPIGFAGGDVNLYGYVLNSPINWVDPWGLRICRGKARILEGNYKHIGKQGGFYPVKISPTGAAIDPAQWGGDKGKLRPYLQNISGESNRAVLFDNVSEVMGTASAREKLKGLNPDTLLIELPGGKDLGVVDIIITVPDCLSCPDGTK